MRVVERWVWVCIYIEMRAKKGGLLLCFFFGAYKSFVVC